MAYYSERSEENFRRPSARQKKRYAKLQKGLKRHTRRYKRRREGDWS